MGDYEALAKGLRKNYGKRIYDEQSFKSAFKDYMGKNNADLEEMVYYGQGDWEGYGDHYKLSMEKIAQNVSKVTELEVKGGKVTQKEKKDVIYDKIGYQKNKIVYVRLVYFITKKGTTIKRYIGRNGRYARYKE